MPTSFIDTADLPHPNSDDASSSAGRPRSFRVHGHVVEVAQAQAGLHIVATPIGNLQDITLRALTTLAGVDVIACEDTRITSRLLERYSISRPLMPYHEHNGSYMRPKLLEKLAQGASIALVSDAGTPLVSDPGFKLVKEVAKAGVRVVPLPGPSAVMAGLVAAGLPTDCFMFVGFLPPKTVGRRNRLAELVNIPASLVFFETGPRLAECLQDLAQVLGAREAAVCREMTKMYENVARGTLDALALQFADQTPKGEIVLVVAPPLPPSAPEAKDVDALLRTALLSMHVKEAAITISAQLHLPRKQVYARALELKNASSVSVPHEKTP